MAVVSEWTDEEVEESRLEDITKACKNNELDINQLKERYCCELGYREALHLAFVQCEIVNSYLVEHPAVTLDKEAYHLAYRAAALLSDLYQRVGQLEEGTRADQPEPEAA